MGFWETIEFKKLIRRVGFLSPLGIFIYLILEDKSIIFYWVMAVLSLVLYIIQLVIIDDFKEENKMEEGKPYTFTEQMLDKELGKTLISFKKYVIKSLFVAYLPIINLVYSCYLISIKTFSTPNYINFSLTFVSLGTLLFIIAKTLFYSDVISSIIGYIRPKLRRKFNKRRRLGGLNWTLKRKKRN